MKIFIITIIACLFLMNIVTATCPYAFTQYENINYRFRCLDENNNYCSSTTQLLISIEDPNGDNALNNISMSYNATYFNVTLPTSVLGKSYQAIIISPTSNGTISEFCYDITTGTELGGSGTMTFIIFILFSVIILVISFIFSNYIFAFLAGLSFSITGVYSMIYGFTTTLTTYTRMISIIVLGFGLIITVISALELLKEASEGGNTETTSEAEEEFS